MTWLELWERMHRWPSAPRLALSKGSFTSPTVSGLGCLSSPGFSLCCATPKGSSIAVIRRERWPAVIPDNLFQFSEAANHYSTISVALGCPFLWVFLRLLLFHSLLWMERGIPKTWIPVLTLRITSSLINDKSFPSLYWNDSPIPWVSLELHRLSTLIHSPLSLLHTQALRASISVCFLLCESKYIHSCCYPRNSKQVTFLSLLDLEALGRLILFLDNDISGLSLSILIFTEFLHLVISTEIS